MTDQAYYTRLENRGLIKISGSEAATFLQNLITNDIHLLDAQPVLYACLLTPQGKFLHDFFITKNDTAYILDCEGGDRTLDLAKRLKMYRLRTPIEIEVTEQNTIYVGHGTDFGTPDPRHNDMGFRSFEEPENLPEQPFEIWDKNRIERTIPDGSRDLLIEKSTMDEGRMDILNAVNYDKGCYIGQELTARMHYRGLGKKHLQTVDINNLPDKAELRSQCGDRGIALVKASAS